MQIDRKSALRQSPCVAAALRMASRRLTQLYDDALKPSGLRSTQFTILAELDRRADQPPTMAELASILAMDRSTLGHNLRPLERERLVALREGDADRRQRRVVLTARGRSKFQVAKPLWRAAQDRFDTVFGERESANLRATLLGIAFEQRFARLDD